MMFTLPKSSLLAKSFLSSGNSNCQCLKPAFVRCTMDTLRQSSSSSSSKNTSLVEIDLARQEEEFVTPSPYKNPGPRRYGHETKYKTQGCLPRDGNPVRSLAKYKAVNRWDTKTALFGQNDYIDILGDGNIHPSDLLTGPPWLIAFKGNERERMMRKMEWQGDRTRVLYPAEYDRMQKRIRYLSKLYNTKRHLRRTD